MEAYKRCFPTLESPKQECRPKQRNAQAEIKAAHAYLAISAQMARQGPWHLCAGSFLCCLGLGRWTTHSRGGGELGTLMNAHFIFSGLALLLFNIYRWRVCNCWALQKELDVQRRPPGPPAVRWARMQTCWSWVCPRQHSAVAGLVAVD